MKHYDFSQPGWSADFICGHSDRWPGNKDFVQLTDSIANYRPEQEGFEDYISAVTKKRYADGAKLTCSCMFESYGAPIVVLADKLTGNADGSVTYGPHFEICVWERGCNIWFIVPFPEAPHRTKAYKTAFAEFSLKAGEPVTIRAEVRGRFLDVDINGSKLTAADPHIPETFHVGVTACEGRNRIYALTIE